MKPTVSCFLYDVDQDCKIRCGKLISRFGKFLFAKYDDRYHNNGEPCFQVCLKSATKKCVLYSIRLALTLVLPYPGCPRKIIRCFHDCNSITCVSFLLALHYELSTGG